MLQSSLVAFVCLLEENTHVFLMREEEPNLMHSCWICTASSRVGARTSTMGPSPLSAHAIVTKAQLAAALMFGQLGTSAKSAPSSLTARVEGLHLRRAVR